jgi:hypothetical protein
MCMFPNRMLFWRFLVCRDCRKDIQCCTGYLAIWSWAVVCLEGYVLFGGGALLLARMCSGFMRHPVVDDLLFVQALCNSDIHHPTVVILLARSPSSASQACSHLKVQPF